MILVIIRILLEEDVYEYEYCQESLRFADPCDLDLSQLCGNWVISPSLTATNNNYQNVYLYETKKLHCLLTGWNHLPKSLDSELRENSVFHVTVVKIGIFCIVLLSPVHMSLLQWNLNIEMNVWNSDTHDFPTSAAAAANVSYLNISCHCWSQKENTVLCLAKHHSS